MTNELVKVENLTASYGTMCIIPDLSLRVASGERVAIVGRNGAGKSTLLLAIMGALPGTSSCQLWVNGELLPHHTPASVIRAGVAVVPEGHQVFSDLSVRENLRVGAFHRRRQGRAPINMTLDLVYELFPLLAREQKRQVGQLSGGGQQMVAIGQALMGEPKCLFLDEPSSGLAPAVVDDIFRVLDSLCAKDTAVVVVEQNVSRALSWSERCYVMDNGRIAIEGQSLQLAEAGDVDRLVRGIEPYAPLVQRNEANNQVIAHEPLL